MLPLEESKAEEKLAEPVRTKESLETSRDQLYQQILVDAARIEAQGNLLKRVVKYVKPSVVHIEARKNNTGNSGSIDEAGSGVIVEYKKKFYVVTNRHVIDQAENGNIKIQLHDGRILNPIKLLTDQETDIAVMQIEGTQLIPAQLGDSSKVEIGDFVLAFGSPFGLSQSVTHGIISAKGRFDLQLGRRGLKYQNFMQTDAAINPGNSGGPLLNMRGQVIGINTAIASNSGGNDGIGFTIPMDSVMFIATQLIDHGTVTRSFLGVVLDSAYNEEAANPHGTRINRLEPNSPAEKAGLETGDIILQFNGIEIVNDTHLVNVVKLTPMHNHVQISILRNGHRRELKVYLTSMASLNKKTDD
ncbi:MAG: serine protease [Blastopirellula sp.]|nr:MAG: serine protease [Blastopirellula sp.]